MRAYKCDHADTNTARGSLDERCVISAESRLGGGAVAGEDDEEEEEDGDAVGTVM